MARSSVALVYTLRPRGCLLIALDALILAAAVAATLLFARRQELRCAWEGPVATCALTTRGALELERVDRITGIHSLAQRTGGHASLVTDARNKDLLSSFGTRQLDLWDEASGRALEDFLDARAGSIELAHGPARPLAVTLCVMTGLFLLGVVTRRPGFVLTIDQGAVILRRRGPIARGERRFDLAVVRGFDVEHADDRSRVRLLADTGPLPLTEDFLPGDHHRGFALRASAALRSARDA